MSQLTDQLKPAETPMGEAAPRPDVAGLVVALVGAGITLIALFLKALESSAFTLGGIEKNTLIQQSGGWLFALFALTLAGNAYRAWRMEGSPVWVIIIGVVILGLAIYHGTAHEFTTLAHLNLDGSVNTDLPTVQASPSVGIYAAGLGGVLGAVGGWILYRQ